MGGDFWRRLARDRLAAIGFAIILIFVIVAILAPWIVPYPDAISSISPMQRLKPPSSLHWFGTDRVGSDTFSRLLLGARETLVMALVGVGASAIVGIPIGLLAGWNDGWISDGLMRLADMFLAIPQIVLAIAIAQTLGPSLTNVILALSATLWPWFARLVFTETRILRREAFIEACASLGAGPGRTLMLHVLPNLASQLIVRLTLSMGYAVLTAAALGFLGLGAPAPSPEWGRTVAESREFLPEAWWYAAAPGIAIFLVVMGFNMLGDGLRDVLDPRTRRSTAARRMSAA
jgi:peptide/nickel transport system permease protein